MSKQQGIDLETAVVSWDYQRTLAKNISSVQVQTTAAYWRSLTWSIETTKSPKRHRPDTPIAGNCCRMLANWAEEPLLGGRIKKNESLPER
jgi:hypothetical protein